MTAQVALHATDDGPRAAKPIVLLNSLGCTPAMWDHQAAALLAAGRRVIRFDHRGHGASPVPPAPYSIEELGSDVLDLLDRLGVADADLVGLSLGGMVALWVAASAPERVGRLVVCCTSAYLPPASGWLDRADLVRSAGMSAVTDVLLDRWLSPEFRVRWPDQVERLRSMLLAIDPEGYAGCCEAIAAMDLRPLLPRVVAPALVVSAREDHATPVAHGDLIARFVLNGRLEVIGRSRHLVSVEQPGELSRLILDHLHDSMRPDHG